MSKSGNPETPPKTAAADAAETAEKAPVEAADAKMPEKKVPEVGGPKGLEPTRYGDWERKGRCIDF